MSVANMLREALELGRRSSPVLLEGDPHDPLGDPDQPVTPAAVLVAVVDRPQPGVIFTVRTDTVRKHAGQVAFPGGRVDPEDEDEIAAALREAEEEIELRAARWK
jgi:8-oxo-dGTP pyrophosphatase MutT (NUDIX family)